MRVKTGELKSRLSHYLRQVRESGEEIEVCVRETPVAYITRAPDEPGGAAERSQRRELEAAFQAVGLRLVAPPGSVGTPSPSDPSKPVPVPQPSVAGDGRADIDSTCEARGQRGW